MTPRHHTALIALGSNVGDRVANIHAALQALNRIATVQDTAFLYETPAAYITDQPPFLNTVCRLRTDRRPQELLQELKQTEIDLGRQKTVRFGPRAIDLDILFYDHLVLDADRLTIPHPRLAERDFVLDPLCDLAPDLVHPILNMTIDALWRRLDTRPLPRVMPVAGRLWTWGQKTYVMGIINLSPDSFSGDGLDAEVDIENAVRQAERFVQEGADVLDLGGYSTRPGHVDISIQEEIDRVVPVVAAIAGTVALPVSVDTFRTPVAEAALDAGAHWINDVWGLRLFPDLGRVAAQRHTPLVLMHNRTQPLPAYQDHLAPTPDRGHPRPENTGSGDLIDDVCQELRECLETARNAGVPRWHRIVDPGIGFGKTLPQHMYLIDQLDQVKALGYPLLFGSSRKGFIGKLLGNLPPQERLEGTIATNVIAVDRGADIVRVHDVQANVRAVRMADAIARPSKHLVGGV